MFSLMPRSQGLCGWGEVDLEAGSFGQVLVACHLAAPVIGHRTSHLGVEAVEDLRKSLGGGLGVAVFQPNQSHEERAAFDQRAHLGAVLFALDQVALPVARDQPLQHLGWTLVDQRHVGDGLASIFPRRTLSSLSVGAAQQGEDAA